MRETDITPTPGRIGLPDADDYRGAHQPTADYGARADDLTDMAFDFYEHPEFYPGGPEYPEVVAELRRVHGDPDATITIYQAVPGDVEVIIPVDWVTPSRR